MQRVGFATGYDPALDSRAMARWIRQAEERGFEIGFFSETIELMRDSVSALAVFALATERISLGCTQIVRLRSPLTMAQGIASLDELSEGRIMLAPGACTTTHAKRNGLEPLAPPATLREYVDAVRLILTGDKISYDGQFIRLNNIQLGWRPIRTHVPMYIAATSRKGLEMAGKIGDGVLLNAVCSPEYSANAINIVRGACEAAGRDWSKFDVAQLINCAVEDDHNAALDTMRWEVACKLDPNQLPFIARPKMRVGEPYIREEDIPTFEDAWRRGGMDALIEAVPDSYVEGMTASGTPDEVLAKVDLYREAGVRLPILRPAARDQTERLLDLFTPATIV